MYVYEVKGYEACCVVCFGFVCVWLFGRICTTCVGFSGAV